jgi:hypothetical protein
MDLQSAQLIQDKEMQIAFILLANLFQSVVIDLLKVTNTLTIYNHSHDLYKHSDYIMHCGWLYKHLADLYTGSGCLGSKKHSGNQEVSLHLQQSHGFNKHCHSFCNDTQTDFYVPCLHLVCGPLSSVLSPVPSGRIP